MPDGRRAAAVRFVLRLSARALIFNSHFTRDRFGPTSPARPTIAYPPVDIAALLERPLCEKPAPVIRPVLGVVGQITPWKGQDDAIRILSQLRARFPAACLRIVGSVVFAGPGVTLENDDYARRLVALAGELEVADAVEFVGRTDDLFSVLGSLDMLLVPSWEEPFGRIVAEGMAAGVPVVATNHGGPTELIVDRESGFLAPSRAPEAWIEPVSRLCVEPDLRDRVIRAARARIQAVLDGTPSETVLALYREVGNPSASRGGWRRARTRGRTPSIIGSAAHRPGGRSRTAGEEAKP